MKPFRSLEIKILMYGDLDENLKQVRAPLMQLALKRKSKGYIYSHSIGNIYYLHSDLYVAT
jgi:hypothetical protein